MLLSILVVFVCFVSFLTFSFLPPSLPFSSPFPSFFPLSFLLFLSFSISLSLSWGHAQPFTSTHSLGFTQLLGFWQDRFSIVRPLPRVSANPTAGARTHTTHPAADQGPAHFAVTSLCSALLWIICQSQQWPHSMGPWMQSGQAWEWLTYHLT